jgi:cell division protein FtsQ
LSDTLTPDSPPVDPEAGAADTPIDPRIRARRIAVRRGEGRRRLRRLAVLAVVAAVLAVAAAVTRTPLLDVDQLTVVGAEHTSVAAIVTASHVHRGQPMTDVDMGRARRGIAALPWVRSVSVTRHWPATVVVRLTERTPAAVVAAGQGAAGPQWATLDQDGRVLEVAAAPTPGLARLGGDAGPLRPGEVDTAAGDALRVAVALPPAVAAQVTSIGPAQAGGLELQLAPRGSVAFGPADDIPAKVLALQTVLSEGDVRCLGVLDVRVPTAPVLTPVPSCA